MRQHRTHSGRMRPPLVNVSCGLRREMVDNGKVIAAMNTRQTYKRPPILTDLGSDAIAYYPEILIGEMPRSSESLGEDVMKHLHRSDARWRAWLSNRETIAYL